MSRMKCSGLQRQQKLPAVLQTGTKTAIFTQWLKENFKEKQNTGLPREQMYVIFSRHCSEINKRVECREIFGKLVAETFPSVYKRRLGGRAGMKYYYWSLDVKESSEYFKDLVPYRLCLESDGSKNTVRMKKIKTHSSDGKMCNTLKLNSPAIKGDHFEDEPPLVDNSSGVLPHPEPYSDVLPSERSCPPHNSLTPSSPGATSKLDVIESQNCTDNAKESDSCQSVKRSEGSQNAHVGRCLVNDSHSKTDVSNKIGVRRPGRRAVTSGEASFSAQKRKASNCTCVDCAKDIKKKKSKVHRMSEILASPRMRSSLRQAIKASLVEGSTSDTARPKFVQNAHISDVLPKKRLQKNVDTKNVLQEACQRLERHVSLGKNSETPLGINKLSADGRSTDQCWEGSEEETTVECQCCSPEQQTSTDITQGLVNYDKQTSLDDADNHYKVTLQNNNGKPSDDPLMDKHRNAAEAGSKIWRFLPPLLKELHKEKVKKWLSEEFEWSPPSCLPRHCVYAHYESFCQQHLTCAAPPAMLGKMLQEQFKLLSMRRLGGRNKYKYYYKGLDIQPTSSAYEMLSKERILTSPKPKLSRVFNGSSKPT